ncbi:MAG: hypothetical protein ACRDHY_15445 [Anaerolineales bacterium]
MPRQQRHHWALWLGALCPFLLLPPSQAQITAKAPWEWTTEERLAARFDPEQIAARRAEALAKQDEPGPVPAPGFAVINGARNPELLLPWEIFQHLLAQGLNPLPPLQDEFRRRAEALAPGGELPANFWNRLRLAGGDFLAAAGTRRALIAELNRAPETARAAISAKIAAAGTGYCEKRVRALERARKEFGRDWFDRFLYQAAAADMGLIWPEAESWPEQLRQAEVGCQ